MSVFLLSKPSGAGTVILVPANDRTAVGRAEVLIGGEAFQIYFAIADGGMLPVADRPVVHEALKPLLKYFINSLIPPGQSPSVNITTVFYERMSGKA